MAYSITDITILSTFICSLLSLIGSVLVIFSYFVARLTAKPKTAALILNLAITDFLWFLSSLIQSSFWIEGADVPNGLCYVCSPVVNFCRMASLLWTCAISFDVLMSVRWRASSGSARLGGKGGGEEHRWQEYRTRYYCAIAALSLPGPLYNIYKQHSATGDESLGCAPGYEKLGDGLVVITTELLPIIIGFATNVVVFFLVRQRMAMKAFPQSVRKRRRLVMYHYVLICVICWTPTIIFYISELCGLHSPVLEVISRVSLYSTGFFNFLAFGMQDPHLKRALLVSLYMTGIRSLKTNDVEKNVMFGGDINSRADVTRHKKDIYRYHTLTREQKKILYRERPDLDPKRQYTKAQVGTPGGDGGDLSLSSEISEPLLLQSERSLHGAEELVSSLNAGDGRQMSTEMGAAGASVPYPVTPRHRATDIEEDDEDETASSSDEEDEEDDHLMTPVGSMVSEFFSRSPPSSQQLQG